MQIQLEKTSVQPMDTENPLLYGFDGETYRLSWIWHDFCFLFFCFIRFSKKRISTSYNYLHISLLFMQESTKLHTLVNPFTPRSVNWWVPRFSLLLSIHNLLISWENLAFHLTKFRMGDQFPYSQNLSTYFILLL